MIRITNQAFISILLIVCCFYATSPVQSPNSTPTCSKFCNKVFGDDGYKAYSLVKKCLSDAKTSMGICFDCGPSKTMASTKPDLCHAGSKKAKCVDKKTDLENCGRCGHECHPHKDCCGGNCLVKCTGSGVRDPVTCKCPTTCTLTCDPLAHKVLNMAQCRCDCDTGYEKCKGNCVATCGAGTHRNTDTCACDPDTCNLTCDPLAHKVLNVAQCRCDCTAGYEKCKGNCVATCGAGTHRNTDTCACDPDTCNLTTCTGLHQHVDMAQCQCVCDTNFETCGGNCVAACPAHSHRDQTDCTKCACDTGTDFCRDVNGTHCLAACSNPTHYHTWNRGTCPSGVACGACGGGVVCGRFCCQGSGAGCDSSGGAGKEICTFP